MAEGACPGALQGIVAALAQELGEAAHDREQEPRTAHEQDPCQDTLAGRGGCAFHCRDHAGTACSSATIAPSSIRERPLQALPRARGAERATDLRCPWRIPRRERRRACPACVRRPA